MAKRILLLDNYDSFTYNLAQYLGQLGAQVEVLRNNAMPASEVDLSAYSGVVISPGPCTPTEAGISVDLIGRLARRPMPLLGVCLGHQCLGSALGAKVVRAAEIMHGKTSQILHDGQGLFQGLDQGFVATRYHSLVVEPDSLPDELVVTAWTADKVIMGLRHRSWPLFGVQFHPESVLTASGLRLLGNFLEFCEEVRG